MLAQGIKFSRRTNAKAIMRKHLLTSIATAAFGLIILYGNQALACTKPKAGTYWLGWGTARLIVPPSGRPYQSFRGERCNLSGTYCMSGDNIGAIRTEPNGKVWAYTPSPD